MPHSKISCILGFSWKWPVEAPKIGEWRIQVNMLGFGTPRCANGPPDDAQCCHLMHKEVLHLWNRLWVVGGAGTAWVQACMEA